MMTREYFKERYDAAKALAACMDLDEMIVVYRRLYNAECSRSVFNLSGYIQGGVMKTSIEERELDIMLILLVLMGRSKKQTFGPSLHTVATTIEKFDTWCYPSQIT